MRKILGVTFTVALAGALALPLAARAQTAPAPPSEAEAYTAQVQLGDSQVAAVGHTQAHAEGEAAGGKAHAGALELGPEPPPAEQFGGTQEGPGEASGALINTGGSPLDQLATIAILPWKASVSEDGTGRHSVARASILELALAPGGTKVLSLRALGSDSEAHHTDALSRSKASSDGAEIVLGDPAGDTFLRIVVLHSEASSEQGASTYVVKVVEPGGEHKLVTNEDQLGGGLAQICAAVNIPNVLRLLCVNASGGAATLVQGVLGDGAGQGGVADLITASQAGGAGGAGASVLGEVVQQVDPAVPEAPATGAGELPATGAGLALAALAMVVSGTGMLARRHLGVLRSGR